MWDQLPSPQCHCNISTKELQYENDSIFQPKNILIYLPHVLRISDVKKDPHKGGLYTSVRRGVETPLELIRKLPRRKTPL